MAPPADTEAAATQARSALESLIGQSDQGKHAKHWPDEYEPAIAAVLGALERGEGLRAAWRIRISAPAARAKDVGILAVTDRRVLAAHHGDRGDSTFILPLAEVATVELGYLGATSKDHDAIALLGRDGSILGEDESPAKFDVFAPGRDRSSWRRSIRLGEELEQVRDQLVALLPQAEATASHHGGAMGRKQAKEAIAAADVEQLAAIVAESTEAGARKAAIKALATSSDPAALSALAEAGKSEPELGLRMTAADALRAAGDPRARQAFESVLLRPQEMSIRDTTLQLRALKALDSLPEAPDPDTLAAGLLVAAGDPYNSVGLAERLGQSDEGIAITVLCAALPAPEGGGAGLGWELKPKVVAAFAEALGKLGDPAAIGPLASALRTESARDSQASRAIVEALSQIGDPRAAAPLRSFAKSTADRGISKRASAAADELETHSEQPKRERPRLRQLTDLAIEGLIDDLSKHEADMGCNAAAALGALGDERAVPALRELATARIADKAKRARLAAGAVDALAAIGGERAAGALGAVLGEAVDTARLRAAAQLGRLDPDVAVPILIEAASSDRVGNELKLEVVWALSRFDRPDAIAALEALLASGVRLAVARTLAIIRDPSLRSAFERRLRDGERPVYVLYEIPPNPRRKNAPPTTLVALPDRLLYHRKGSVRPAGEGSGEPVPEIGELPYEQLNRVKIHHPGGRTGVSGKEQLVTGYAVGALGAGMIQTLLASRRELMAQSWVTVGGKGVELDLFGDEFLVRGDDFVHWLRKRIGGR